MSLKDADKKLFFIFKRRLSQNIKNIQNVCCVFFHSSTGASSSVCTSTMSSLLAFSSELQFLPFKCCFTASKLRKHMFYSLQNIFVKSFCTEGSYPEFGVSELTVILLNRSGNTSLFGILKCWNVYSTFNN